MTSFPGDRHFQESKSKSKTFRSRTKSVSPASPNALI
jgi:hypothetical protein